MKKKNKSPTNYQVLTLCKPYETCIVSFNLYNHPGNRCYLTQIYRTVKESWKEPPVTWPDNACDFHGSTLDNLPREKFPQHGLSQRFSNQALSEVVPTELVRNTDSKAPPQMQRVQIQGNGSLLQLGKLLRGSDLEAIE